MVPRAEPERYDSYYGRPVIKAPVWKTPDVPLYLFLGGLAGGSSLLAEGAARPRLRAAVLRLFGRLRVHVGCAFVGPGERRPESRPARACRPPPPPLYSVPGVPRAAI